MDRSEETNNRNDAVGAPNDQKDPEMREGVKARDTPKIAISQSPPTDVGTSDGRKDLSVRWMEPPSRMAHMRPRTEPSGHDYLLQLKVVSCPPGREPPSRRVLCYTAGGKVLRLGQEDLNFEFEADIRLYLVPLWGRKGDAEVTGFEVRSGCVTDGTESNLHVGVPGQVAWMKPRFEPVVGRRITSIQLFSGNGVPDGSEWVYSHTDINLGKGRTRLFLRWKLEE